MFDEFFADNMWRGFDSNLANLRPSDKNRPRQL